MKLIKSSFLISLIYLFFASNVAHAHNVFEPSTDLDTYVQNVSNELNRMAPAVSTIVSTVFVLMFLAGVIQLGYSLLTKTGMVMKTSTGVLIGVPLVVVFLRLFFIIAFTKDLNPAELVTDFMNLLTATGFYTAIGMTLSGFVMLLFHKLLNHPGFQRWSKRLFVGSVSLALLTAVMPAVLQSI